MASFRESTPLARGAIVRSVDSVEHDVAKDETMIRSMRLLAVFLAVTALSGCATIAGGLIGTGVGVATGHPVSGALIGTGVGLMIDTAPRQ